MAYIDKYGVKFSDDRTILFLCPQNLSGNYEIPEGVTRIGLAAFGGCRDLSFVKIPQSMTTIGKCAFDDCKGLQSVVIPDSISNIDNNTFFACSGLTSVTIPDSVTNIGDEAFYGCSGLTSITIPKSVRSIGKDAFLNCRNLKNVKIYRREFESILKEQLPSSANIIVEESHSSKEHHVCSKCGYKDIPAEAQFCPECGKKL